MPTWAGTGPDSARMDLAQARDLPADQEREAEKQDKRREHRAHPRLSTEPIVGGGAGRGAGAARRSR